MSQPSDHDDRRQPKGRAVIVEDFSLPEALPPARKPLSSARRADGNRSRARPDVYVATMRRWRGRT